MTTIKSVMPAWSPRTDNSYSAPRVVCRPALPRDKAEVLEFTKFIWDGHDYIKYVWDDWLADPSGLLAVAEYGGRAVGLAKITALAVDQWWFEGFRVDPKFQGLKIGSHLHEYIDAWWLAHCKGAVRLMTSSQRVQVHHLCDRMGYSKIGEVYRYYAPVSPGRDHGFAALSPAESDRAMGFVRSNPGPSRGLIDLSWRLAALDKDLLEQAIQRGQAFWWRGDQGLLLHWEDEDEGERILGIGLPVCGQGRLAELLEDVRRLAAQQGYSSVSWMSPASDEVKAALQEAGYVTDWDGSAYLYEKQRA